MTFISKSLVIAVLIFSTSLSSGCGELDKLKEADEIYKSSTLSNYEKIKGLYYFVIDEPDDSKVSLTKDMYSVLAKINEGYSLATKGDVKQATQYCMEKYLSTLYKEKNHYLVCLAYIDEREKDYEEAIKKLEESIKVPFLLPDMRYSVIYKLSQLHLLAGNEKESELIAQKILDCELFCSKLLRKLIKENNE